MDIPGLIDSIESIERPKTKIVDTTHRLVGFDDLLVEEAPLVDRRLMVQQPIEGRAISMPAMITEGELLYFTVALDKGRRGACLRLDTPRSMDFVAAGIAATEHAVWQCLLINVAPTIPHGNELRMALQRHWADGFGRVEGEAEEFHRMNDTVGFLMTEEVERRQKNRAADQKEYMKKPRWKRWLSDMGTHLRHGVQYPFYRRSKKRADAIVGYSRRFDGGMQYMQRVLEAVREASTPVAPGTMAVTSAKACADAAKDAEAAIAKAVQSMREYIDALQLLHALRWA